MFNIILSRNKEDKQLNNTKNYTTHNSKESLMNTKLCNVNCTKF